jgi:2-haloacid dehalogenase
VSLPESDARALQRSWGSMPIFDDVEPMLAELRRRGWRLGVLTNCDDDLFEITHRSFRAPFDLFVTAERVRGYKPAPWHFRAFQQLAHVNHCEWVHVACSWYHDIAPARELGVQTVWLDRERTGEDASIASARVLSASEVSRRRRDDFRRVLRLKVEAGLKDPPLRCHVISVSAMNLRIS